MAVGWAIFALDGALLISSRKCGVGLLICCRLVLSEPWRLHRFSELDLDLIE